jgi:TetR/AcrR family transcriptional regulator, mexJK operon transcriptional repressor
LHYHIDHRAASRTAPILDNSLETGPFKRGPGGRPTRDEAERRHRDLLDATRRLLLARGWDATSIDEISRQSGVAKRFIYARYADKTALFIGAMERFREDQIGALDLGEPLPGEVEEGLFALGRRLLDIALTDEALAILRLFVAEAPRLREHARLMIERPQRGLETMARVLLAYEERGALVFEDRQFAIEHFFTLIVALPQRLAIFLGRQTPEEEARRLRAAVRLFLNGCGRSAERHGEGA